MSAAFGPRVAPQNSSPSGYLIISISEDGVGYFKLVFIRPMTTFMNPY